MGAEMIYRMVFVVVFIEALTEIITKSEITEPIRAFIFKMGHKNKFYNWLHRLLDCGYCTSVWIGLFAALFLFRDIHIISPYLDWIFIGLILHRLSNVFHFIVDRIRGIE
jgi:hypothetical protein